MKKEEKRRQFNASEFISNKKTPVETRDGRKVTIYNTNRATATVYKVCGDIHTDKGFELSTWMSNGIYQSDNCSDKYDLFFSPKKTTRRMTHKELAWWLKESGEHREYKKVPDGTILSEYAYLEKYQDEKCDDEIMIRSNGGEWRMPEIEIKDEGISEMKPEVKEKEERKQFNAKDYISDIKTPVETRDGRAVVINKFRVNAPSPILTDFIEGFVEGNSGIVEWNGKGKFSIIGEESEYDLFFKTLGKSNDKRD